MKPLQPGMMIALTDGRRVKVKRMLGEGAQGWVYLVDCPERPRDVQSPRVEKALKWYKRCPSPDFMTNLEKNVAEGAPSAQFIWPEAVCRRQLGSTGYLMPLRPEGFYQLSDFRLAKVRFQSFAAILRACLETCEAFKQLHLNGLSYQDLNDGGFYIHPETGQVLIGDNDNVFPHGQVSGVLGKARYMAPEIVEGKATPDTYSDRFSLAVILFMYIFIDHPFEGANVLREECLAEEEERRLFGEQLCFIYDVSRRNPPVAGVHRNVLLFWKMWPARLKELFVQEFSADKLRHPQRRLTEHEWINAFMQVRDLLVSCPRCGDETFVGRDQKTFIDRLTGHTDRCLNPRCKRPVEVKYLLSKASRHIPLVLGSKIYFDQIAQPSAQVHVRMQDPNMLLLRNLETVAWQVITRSGKHITILPGGYVPIKSGLKIQTAHATYEITE